MILVPYNLQYISFKIFALQHTYESHNIISQPTTSHHKIITPHPIASHHFRSDNIITWAYITWHRIASLYYLSQINDITSLRNPMSSHTTSQPIRLQKNYITTTEVQPATTKWNGQRLVLTKTSVWPSHWLAALRTLYRQCFLWLIGLFPFEISAPRLPGSACNYV